MARTSMRLFELPLMDSRVRSANTQASEKWLGYFLGPIGAAILNVTVISYINIFYTDVLDLNGVQGGMFLVMFPVISKIIDAITNIVMGQIIERTRTRQGKARPWVLISAPLMTITCILMFLVPRENSLLQLALIVLSYNLFYSFSYTIYNMSHTLMVPLSTTNVQQRDGLSLFSNMGSNMIPGIIVSLLFPMMLMPVLGVDYDKWVLAMSVLAVLALPLTVLEYYYTKERITEAAAASGSDAKISVKEQLQACLSCKYWVIMILILLMFQIQSNLGTISLPYFCNWVLGTYNDGSTQAILSAVGKAPLGFGVFILWPLVKKFGKRKVMIVGFLIAAGGEALCWVGSTNLSLMLVGSFVYAIGWLPSYVLTALMADALDYVECDKGIRCDGLTASIYTIIVTVSVGIGQGIFNLGLRATGYVAPYLVSEGVYNVQNETTRGFITFAYIGVPMILLLVMSIVMVFFRVEDELPAVHQTLTDRRKAEAEARGEVYYSVEEKAAMEQAENDRIAEENRVKELRARCAKKGLDYNTEEAKYQAKRAAAKAKAEAKAARSIGK